MKAKSLCPEALFVEISENVGAYHATFEGLDRVACDYVVRCDADDELTTGFIAKVKECLSRHPYDIVSMPHLRIDHSQQTPSALYKTHLEKPREYLDFPHCLDAFFSTLLPWYITGKAIRTEIFKSIRLSSIPKKICLDDVFITMLVYAVSHSFISPDTDEGYIYHFGIGYYSREKRSVSFEWWKDTADMRKLEWEVNSTFLKSLGFESYTEKLFNVCEPLDLIETIPLLPAQNVADASSVLVKMLRFRYKD